MDAQMTVRHQRRSKTFSISFVEEIDDELKPEEEPTATPEVQERRPAIARWSGQLLHVVRWLVRAFIAVVLEHLGSLAAFLRRHG